MKKSRQVKRKKALLATKNPITKISLKPNRHDRRAEIAFQRRLPQIVKKMTISKNIKDTKKEGRIAKQKHIDEVTARTAKRKELKKLNKTK